MREIPPRPGTYLLGLTLFDPVQIRIGALGEFLFRPGGYYYIGRAHGPGGLNARITRHMVNTVVKHCHIDWLSPFTVMTGII